MECASLNYSGQFFQSSLDDCQYVVLSKLEYDNVMNLVDMLQTVNITTDDILTFYSWGFGAVFIPFLSAYAVKWVLKTIKLL